LLAWPGTGFQTEAVHVLTLEPGHEGERYRYDLAEEAFLCHSGSAEIWLRERWVRLEPGDLAYVPEGVDRAGCPQRSYPPASLTYGFGYRSRAWSLRRSFHRINHQPPTTPVTGNRLSSVSSTGMPAICAWTSTDIDAPESCARAPRFGGRSREDLRRTVTALQAHLVRSRGPTIPVMEVDEEVTVDLHSAIREAVHSQEP
jgi:hypothetical protein